LRLLYRSRLLSLVSSGHEQLGIQAPVGYIDRILKGALPRDLPIQAPRRYELVINLKTGKALNLEVTPRLPARADEVIE
jgi:putative ABC transport system substrate-binding protein